MAPGVVLTLLAATLLPAPTPPSLPPEDAWVAAKVELAQNNTERALTLVVRALPQGGPLAPLLRLEAAAIALRLGRDPYRYLAPLLRGPVPPNIARRAQELLLQGAEVLPLGQVTGWLKQPLPAFLRRQLRGVLALRTQDRAQSLQLLEEKANDALAGRLAQWLVATPLQRQEAGIVAGALLQTGHWQEAFDLLRTVPYHPEEGFPITFLRARTAYRLARWEEALQWFQLAKTSAPTAEDWRRSALFAARAWEQLGQEDCAEETYREQTRAYPDELDGWHGLLMVLARRGEGFVAVQTLERAPRGVRQSLAPRLCAMLVIHGHLAAARQALRLARFPDPALLFCQAYLDFLDQRGEQAKEALVRLLVHPEAGALRELAVLLLPAGTGGEAKPTRQLEDLARLAAWEGVEVARQGLYAALLADPPFAPLFSGSPEPALPHPLRYLIGAGYARDVALFLPHLLPQDSPRALSWSAGFLAKAGNYSDALAMGERLWRAIGPIPAFLLPEPLLPHLVPPSFLQVLPAAPRQQMPLLFALARQESRFHSTAFSAAGARGLWQIMPTTARRLGGDPQGLDQPAPSGFLAVRLLQTLERRLGQDPLVLAAAYNAGEGWVELWLAGANGPHPLFPLVVPYGETRAYILKVAEGMSLARHLK